MAEKRDYYEVLGVDRDADQRTIKRAFLKKARTVHPDVSDDPDADNTLDEPAKIVPAESALNIGGSTLDTEIGPQTFAIYTLPVVKAAGR